MSLVLNNQSLKRKDKKLIHTSMPGYESGYNQSTITAIQICTNIQFLFKYRTKESLMDNNNKTITKILHFKLEQASRGSRIPPQYHYLNTETVSDTLSNDTSSTMTHCRKFLSNYQFVEK